MSKVRIELPRAFEVEKIEAQIDPGTGEGRIEITPFTAAPARQAPVVHLFLRGADGVLRGWKLYVVKGEKLSLVQFGPRAPEEAAPEGPAPEEPIVDERTFPE